VPRRLAPYAQATKNLEKAKKVWDGEESELAQVHNALGFCYFNMDRVRRPAARPALADPRQTHVGTACYRVDVVIGVWHGCGAASACARRLYLTRIVLTAPLTAPRVQTDMALGEYRRAVELQPGYVTAWYASASGSCACALRCPRAASAWLPPKHAAWDLGVCRNNMGDALEKERKWK
jgi:hypothetical protein